MSTHGEAFEPRGRGVIDIQPVVRSKALAAGATQWLDELPALVADLEREWSIEVGRPYDDATEAFVAEATLDDGTGAVLKLLVPRAGDAAANEITVLRLTNGDGCVRLLRDDEPRGALLLERLGRSLHELALPARQRHEILSSTAARVWRPAPGCGLPTGAEKGRWLVDFISKRWEELDRPCSERAVHHALACAARRIDEHATSGLSSYTVTFTSGTCSKPRRLQARRPRRSVRRGRVRHGHRHA